MLSETSISSKLGIILLPVALVLALSTGGCNTMRGVGEDVEAAGGAMAGTAEKTEEKIEEGVEGDSQ
jgi:predicted small secreted protein